MYNFIGKTREILQNSNDLGERPSAPSSPLPQLVRDWIRGWRKTLVARPAHGESDLMCQS